MKNIRQFIVLFYYENFTATNTIYLIINVLYLQ